MLDEPHDVRLHMQRAILGSYNLNDPPWSTNISYSGPQWVPDNLRVAWRAAETLMHYVPDDTLVTYESACRMLKLVLPDQHKRCEVRIELLLMANRLVPERVLSNACSSVISNLSRQESRCSHRPRRQGSRSSSSLQDTIDGIVRDHMALMDKIARENREFRSQFGQTTLQDPTPTPHCSSSASEIAPHNESPCLVASAGFVEPEHALKTPREQVGSVLRAVSLGAPTAL